MISFQGPLVYSSYGMYPDNGKIYDWPAKKMQAQFTSSYMLWYPPSVHCKRKPALVVKILLC